MMPSVRLASLEDISESREDVEEDLENEGDGDIGRRNSSGIYLADEGCVSRTMDDGFRRSIKS